DHVATAVLAAGREDDVPGGPGRTARRHEGRRALRSDGRLVPVVLVHAAGEAAAGRSDSVRVRDAPVPGHGNRVALDDAPGERVERLDAAEVEHLRVGRRDTEARIEAPALTLNDRAVDLQLDALVLELADVLELAVAEAERRHARHVHERVGRLLAEVGERRRQAVVEPRAVESGLELGRHFRTQVRVAAVLGQECRVPDVAEPVPGAERVVRQRRSAGLYIYRA